MRIWSILLIKSDLKWCIHLSRSLFSYLFDICSVLGCFTVDVIASTGFGVDINSHKDTNNEFLKHAKVIFADGLTSPLIIIGGKNSAEITYISAFK